jgi:hypothetical protein
MEAGHGYWSRQAGAWRQRVRERRPRGRGYGKQCKAKGEYRGRQGGGGEAKASSICGACGGWRVGRVEAAVGSVVKRVSGMLFFRYFSWPDQPSTDRLHRIWGPQIPSTGANRSRDQPPLFNPLTCHIWPCISVYTHPCTNKPLRKRRREGSGCTVS